MTEHPRTRFVTWLKRESRSYSVIYKDQLEAIVAMLESDAEVRKAAEALVTSLDACRPEMVATFMVAHIHGFKASADSPTFHVELAALRALLRREA